MNREDDYAIYYSDGRIYRKERKDTLGRKVSAKFLQTEKPNTGKYCQVSVNGVSKGVHRFILEMFSPRDDMHTLQVNHIDGNQMNNDISNLEWVTGSENHRHAIDTEEDASFAYDKAVIAYKLPYKTNYIKTNDFESRICKNCAEYKNPYYDKWKKKEYGACDILIEEVGMYYTPHDFGCNKFDRSNP